MNVRRVVTGHTAKDTSVVVSDDEVVPMLIGPLGDSVALLWGRDDPGEFPDDGAPREMASVYPLPGGSVCSVWELAPDSDHFDQFIVRALTPWADVEEPGVHRTPTLDYNVVLAGVIGLEVDDGEEVTLGVGDVVVQNGTRHRWHNRGDTAARVLSVMVGAHNRLEGGGPG